MKYYYFVAALPAVSLDGPFSLSWEDFLRRCDEFLQPDDRRAIEALSEPIDVPARHPFIARWRRMEVQVRNAVVRNRAARLRRDATPYLRDQEGFDLRIVNAVGDAFSKENPRDREAALDRLRWALIEEAAGVDPFALDAVLAYALKLRLAERWARLDRPAGRRAIESFVNRPPESTMAKQTS